MKIALAQIQPTKGNIAVNIQQHKYWVEQAIQQEATLIVFPELSLTGYEPNLAQELAITSMDSRLEELQLLSTTHSIIIGLGAPVKTTNGIHIGLILLHPHQSRQIYLKKYLHTDEVPFFVTGENEELFIAGTSIAPAICYELSVTAHFQAAQKKQANYYLASVAKTEKGMQAARERLSTLAKTYQLPTLLVNCVGFCDNFESAGQSAVWDATGNLLGQLSKDEEGLLIYDSVVQVVEIY